MRECVFNGFCVGITAKETTRLKIWTELAPYKRNSNYFQDFIIKLVNKARKKNYTHQHNPNEQQKNVKDWISQTKQTKIEQNL